MSFGHAWARERDISDRAWEAATRAARLAFESLPERALWGPQSSGSAPSWEGGAKPDPATLGVWMSLNSPPALAGLDGALCSDSVIEALPGADAWMAYPARLEREASAGLASTGAKAHDLVILAALCAIEAQDPGAVWIRHTDGDATHWSGALSWLRTLPGAPRLHLPAGAPGRVPGLALMEKERAEIQSALERARSPSEIEGESGKDGKSGSGRRARKV